MAANDVPLFWFLDPGFWTFAIVGGGGAFVVFVVWMIVSTAWQKMKDKR